MRPGLFRRLCTGLIGVVLLAACSGKEVTIKDDGVPASITLGSSAFEAGGSIPARYTCSGDNISPPLEWDGVPAGAQSLALIVDDPDAPKGTWVHWLAYNLPVELRSLPEAVQPDEQIGGSGLQGRNGWKAIGYGGPCPPSGQHRYFFQLYALDIILDLDEGASKKDLAEKMENHILARGELIGVYRKP